MKIAVTGGHLTPALAFIHAFRQENVNAFFFFIGRTFAQEKEKMVSKEKQIVESLGIPFYPILASKFHRTYFWKNFGEFFRLFPSIVQSYHILKDHRPDIFVSFGGYVAFPVAVSAKILGIPIITHEQTRTAGLANRIIAHLATKVAVSHEDSVKHFPKGKTVITGNPVRPAFLQPSTVRPDWMFPSLTKPLVFITGGSQGSYVLNKTVGEIIRKLSGECYVVHQCGSAHESKYATELEVLRDKLPKVNQKRVIIREWIDEVDVAWMFEHADVVIARSGANTVQEILLSEVPAIFIPLPFSHDNEQVKNAQYIEEAGGAMIITQKKLNKESLWGALETVLRTQKKMKLAVSRLKRRSILDGSARLVRLCEDVLKKNEKLA